MSRSRPFTYLLFDCINITLTLLGYVKYQDTTEPTKLGYIIRSYTAGIRDIQGPRTQIDAFQTNNISWMNDIHVKSQWFLGSWDREIWYQTFNFYFINLTWPPQPQKAEVPTFLRDVGVAPPWCCHTLVISAPRSWVLRLLYKVFFVSVIGLVPSESWKRLESGGYKVYFYWSKNQAENSLNFSDM
jgi:hypothetical protein